MQSHAIMIKSIIKVLLVLVVVWLIAAAINATFSSYVEPLDYYSSVL